MDKNHYNNPWWGGVFYIYIYTILMCILFFEGSACLFLLFVDVTCKMWGLTSEPPSKLHRSFWDLSSSPPPHAVTPSLFMAKNNMNAFQLPSHPIPPPPKKNTHQPKIHTHPNALKPKKNPSRLFTNPSQCFSGEKFVGWKKLPIRSLTTKHPYCKAKRGGSTFAKSTSKGR